MEHLKCEYEIHWTSVGGAGPVIVFPAVEGLNQNGDVFFLIKWILGKVFLTMKRMIQGLSQTIMFHFYEKNALGWMSYKRKSNFSHSFASLRSRRNPFGFWWGPVVFCVCQRSRKEAGIHMWKENWGTQGRARISLLWHSNFGSRNSLSQRCMDPSNDLTIALRSSYQPSTLTLCTKCQCVLWRAHETFHHMLSHVLTSIKPRKYHPWMKWPYPLGLIPDFLRVFIPWLTTQKQRRKRKLLIY